LERPAALRILSLVQRRAALKLLLTAAATPLLAACERAASKRPTMSSASRMPSIFLAHGSPLLLDDDVWVDELRRWADAMPRPKAVLVISAHWLDAPVTLGATRTVPLVYDFYGFPKRYYDLRYPAPGAPDLARRVRELLSPVGPVADAPERGLDHGAYVPLVAMYPRADVPVLQMSIPTIDPEPLLQIGRRLAPLRHEGVLLVGSGFLTHNLRAISLDGPPRDPPAWSSEFDAWSRDVLEKRDVDALVHYRERAPGVRMALPTHEHFVPVAVAMGASIDATEPVAFPITGFAYGSMTKRSVQFG
jgi:4,5-DOPA dioxygenase extradiol